MNIIGIIGSIIWIVVFIIDIIGSNTFRVFEGKEIIIRDICIIILSLSLIFQ